MQHQQGRQQAAEEQSRDGAQRGGMPHVQDHVLWEHIEPRQSEHCGKCEENSIRR